MSRLGNWLEHLEELYKARQRPGISAAAVDAMNQHLGPASYGDRHEVARWINENGGERIAATRAKGATEGSVEHKAGAFIAESRSYRRSTSQRAQHAALHTDSITTPISATDRAHHAQAWASYHEHVEHKLGAVPDLAVDDYGAARMAPRSRAPIQQKANHIIARDTAVAREGHHPYHNLKDIDTLAHAVHAMSDHFTTHELNRFHVMHDAINLRAESHHETFGDKRVFKPSWSSIEPTALHVMHRAAQMIHHVGDDRARLVGVTGAALRAQEAHPAGAWRRGEGAQWMGREGYPALHPVGSELQQRSHEVMDSLYRKRGTGEAKKPLVEKPTVAPPTSTRPAIHLEDGSVDAMSAEERYASEKAKYAARRALNKAMAAKLAKSASAVETDDDPIAYPAIRLHDGTVVTGETNHAHAARRALAAGHSKTAVTRALLMDPHGAGFVTRSGKYLPRTQAFHVAVSHGQLKAGAQSELERMKSPQMDSGDVVWRRSFAAVADYVRGLAA